MSVCVFLPYLSVMQNASFVHHFNIVICGLPGSTNIFPAYLINGSIFGKKGYVF
jgi:hypothetical protein